MERWTLKYNRIWTIVVAKSNLIYKARASNGVVYFDTKSYITFNEAKDSAIQLIKQSKKVNVNGNS